jgi:hypothetical protein
MKHYYRLWDAITQVLLLTGWAIATATKARWLTAIQVVAIPWYVASLAIHFIISTQKFKPVYRNFILLCIGLTALVLYGFAMVYILVAEVTLLPFLLPPAAVLYSYQCISEIFYLRKRPISYLK